MSVILGRGDEAKKAIEGNGGGGGLDFKKAFIKLKAGQSRKVRILSPNDYVAYKAHSHYSKGIYTQPCIASTGERCLLCEAQKYDKETDKDGNSVWGAMYAKKRVMFAFVDLEEGAEDEDGNPEGMLRVFDATKSQADAIISTIDEYADDLDEVAFTFKRTGEKTDTSYSLNPIMPKKMKEVQPTFDKFDEEEVSDKIFEQALQPRTTEEQAKELQKAGFPVKSFLNYEVTEEDSSDEEPEGEQEEGEDEGEAIDTTEDENEDPTNNF
ncbi:hypothetical protein CHL76_02300 [Marinococcus halophilus]|uniref:Bacteriophage T4 Gp32 single-stranded DNA-binding domain-containing protein n=1 Tax=Marinococcus halophilus TaxID=1371 RepID=A0A510Y2R8_MARHA|nr:hypothetical protein [Marinococcus halophilus]OZT81208.1 hypothetical protein CHL76_02300 [Marinococcus halophilus]GEK57141.1 hypothetical protein MHA01_00460 [Marinococcus halophilus]